MRSSKSRSRSKSNRQRSLGNIINRVFDSSGPEGKVRGTPQQIIDKYLMLARDAQLSNDRVAEQAFLQHAEHYTRMLGEATREMAREQEQRQNQSGQNLPGQNLPGQNQSGQNGNGGSNGNGGGYSGQDRGENNRDRYEPRSTPRNDDNEQPDFAPLGTQTHDTNHDDGPGLVETPEMHQPRQRSSRADAASDTDQPDIALTAPAADRPASRGDRGPRPPRGPRKPRSDKKTSESGGQDAAPSDAEKSPAGDAE
jgi:hypothetical protein